MQSLLFFSVMIIALFIAAVVLLTMCIYLLTTAIASNCMSISLLSVIMALSAEIDEYRSAFAAHFFAAFTIYLFITRFVNYLPGCLGQL